MKSNRIPWLIITNNLLLSKHMLLIQMKLPSWNMIFFFLQKGRKVPQKKPCPSSTRFGVYCNHESVKWYINLCWYVHSDHHLFLQYLGSINTCGSEQEEDPQNVVTKRRKVVNETEEECTNDIENKILDENTGIFLHFSLICILDLKLCQIIVNEDNMIHICGFRCKYRKIWSSFTY